MPTFFCTTTLVKKRNVRPQVPLQTSLILTLSHLQAKNGLSFAIHMKSEHPERFQPIPHLRQQSISEEKMHLDDKNNRQEMVPLEQVALLHSMLTDKTASVGTSNNPNNHKIRKRQAMNPNHDQRCGMNTQERIFIPWEPQEAASSQADDSSSYNDMESMQEHANDNDDYAPPICAETAAIVNAPQQETSNDQDLQQQEPLRPRDD
ncbi:hypothetical protein BC940DRAFT_295424 [Gongronella butleri]|nr:hypothetical protein BC940DRAFT_295424 [Gongronella butleri]